jgi:exopolysaccharide production protein ExoZ
MNRKLEFLQVLRATAALLVVACHSIYFLSTKEILADVWETLGRSLGIFGVSLFFVISGFIMIHTSANLFDTANGPTSFAYRRILRIVPMYWMATAIEICLSSYRHSSVPNLGYVFRSLFFLPYISYPGFPLRPILGVGWTLNHEMFFYALFAISLLFRRAIGVAFITFVLISVVYLGSFLKPLSDTAEPVTVATFVCNPIILLFAGGVLLGFVLKRVAAAKFTFPFAGTIAVSLIILAIGLFVTVLAPAPLFRDLKLAAWPILWQVFFYSVCVVIVGLGVVARVDQKYAVPRWFIKLGDASYSIYLFHFTIIVVVGKLWGMAFKNGNEIAFIGASFVTATVGGFLIYRLVERPLLSKLVGPRERSESQERIEIAV